MAKRMADVIKDSEMGRLCQGNKIKNKISCLPQKALHQGRGERKQFCYWISIKPARCMLQAMHKETAKRERNVMLSDSSADAHMFSRESVTGSG